MVVRVEDADDLARVAVAPGVPPPTDCPERRRGSGRVYLVYQRLESIHHPRELHVHSLRPAGNGYRRKTNIATWDARERMWERKGCRSEEMKRSRGEGASVCAVEGRWGAKGGNMCDCPIAANSTLSQSTRQVDGTIGSKCWRAFAQHKVHSTG